jgi:hypothetical protein
MHAVRQDENALPASAIITGAAAARWYYRHHFRLTCRHGFRCRSMLTRFQKGRQSSFLPPPCHRKTGRVPVFHPGHCDRYTAAVSTRSQQAATRQKRRTPTNRFPFGFHLELHPHAGHDGIDVVEIGAAAVQLVKAGSPDRPRCPTPGDPAPFAGPKVSASSPFGIKIRKTAEVGRQGGHPQRAPAAR